MISTQIDADERQRQTDEKREKTSPETIDIPMDEIFHILQNERRRNVLQYLRDTDGPVRMRDVAEQVAAWEHDTTVQALTSDQRQRVYIPLYQSHLPKLDKAGLIEYQQKRGIVERKPLADTFDRFLEVNPESESESEPEPASEPASENTRESEWDDYYIGAAGIGAVILLGAVFELPFFSVFSGIALSAIILLMFTLLTAGRYIK